MAHIQTALSEVQEGLFQDAKTFRDANIKEVATYDELKKAIDEGYWARGPWAGAVFILDKLPERKSLSNKQNLLFELLNESSQHCSCPHCWSLAW